MGFQIKRRTVVAWCLVLFSFAEVDPVAFAQQPTEKKDELSSAKLDKNVEAEHAAAMKKLFRTRPKLRGKTKIEIMIVKGIKAKKAVKFLKIYMGDRLEFAAEAVPGVDILLIRGTAKTVEKAKSFIYDIETCGSADHHKKRPPS